jgi:23S rRNA (pseudouridine1915-N3)-methyltransferase
MKINIFVIDKKSKNSLYAPLIEHYKRVCRPFAKVETYDIYTQEIIKSHNISTKTSQKSYTLALSKYLSRGYNIALDPNSKEVDSYSFSDLLKDRATVNLFIGGAFGFERDFLTLCNKSISLGKITMSHKLTKVVLMEQIFRGLAILNNHPYHK